MGKQDLEESDDSWEEVVIKRRKTKKEDLEDLDTYDHLDALACVIRNHKVSARLDRKLKREATTKDKGSSSILKGLVSKEKKRFQIDGFNQDLAYITDRIIAMGFPATGTLEKLYRNDVADIKNFFTKRHSEHHKVYNQCIEKDHDYGDDTFDDYAHYPFWDHNVAPLAEIFKFCKDANQYLESDVLNIIAVHCKAGKSRTGLMICCYLLWSKQFINKSDAINYFNRSAMPIKSIIIGGGLIAPVLETLTNKVHQIGIFCGHIFWSYLFCKNLLLCFWSFLRLLSRIIFISFFSERRVLFLFNFLRLRRLFILET